MKEITDKQYRDKQYEYHDFQTLKSYRNDPISQLIIKFLKNNIINSVIEIGCYPGRYLEIFWKKWIEINGIDYTEKIDTMIHDFQKKQYKIWNFFKEYFPFKWLKKYWLVCSFWFIEHFENYEEIIIEHIKIVEDWWYIMITVPNFKYWFQNRFHKNFDKKNYSNHNIQSMNPDNWQRILENKWFWYINKWFIWWFDFWFEREKRNVFRTVFIYSLLLLKISINKVLLLFGKSLNNIPNNKIYSPFCYIIAKKWNSI